MRSPVLPFAAVLASISLLALVPDTSAPRPVAPADLFGQPFAKALEALGPPDSGSGTTGCLMWRWRDSSGGLLRVVTHRDVVVLVDDSRAKADIVARPVPAEGHYPGQPLAELLQRLGPPTRAGGSPRMRGNVPLHMPTQAGQPVLADLGLQFGELRLLVSAGRVLGREPKAPPVRGPR